MKKIGLLVFILLFGLGQICLAAPPQKIIFDCDLAGDIDDAFALALILTSPEFEVLGITMEHGLTEKRAQVACRMLYEVGKENIPVVVGRQTPLVVGKDKELPPPNAQFIWGEDFSKVKPIAMPAADFILQNLRKYPHEVVLITVGPVPNISDLLQKDPASLKLAKKIYSMFGSFYMGYGSSLTPSAEWNVVADVASSKKFVGAGAPITYAGLDITTFVTLDEKNRLKLTQRQTPLTNALTGLYTLWSSETGAEAPVLYDVVAVSMFLWPDLFQTRPAHVKVTDGGYTVIDESQPPNGEVGVSVNKEELIRRIMKRYIQQNLGRD
jgi:purine nucleosidase